MTAYSAIATLLGIGRLRPAPGTIASIVAVPLAWGLSALGGPLLLIAAAAFVTIVGIWACERYVREQDNEDPPECVIDELAGQWLACAFAPLGIVYYVIAFVLFRVFDILKPWPISVAETLKGGLGVMADDVVAGALAGVVVAAIAHTGIV